MAHVTLRCRVFHYIHLPSLIIHSHFTISTHQSSYIAPVPFSMQPGFVCSPWCLAPAVSRRGAHRWNNCGVWCGKGPSQKECPGQAEILKGYCICDAAGPFTFRCEIWQDVLFWCHWHSGGKNRLVARQVAILHPAALHNAHAAFSGFGTAMPQSMMPQHGLSRLLSQRKPVGSLPGVTRNQMPASC